MTLSIVAKDGSKPSVSCLNFEPRVSKFPVLEVGATSNTSATMKSHILFRNLFTCPLLWDIVNNNGEKRRNQIC